MTGATLFGPRELEVLELRAKGATYAAVAQRLGITQSEARTYASRITRKVRLAQATLDAAQPYLARLAGDP